MLRGDATGGTGADRPTDAGLGAGGSSGAGGGGGGGGGSSGGGSSGGGSGNATADFFLVPFFFLGFPLPEELDDVPAFDDGEVREFVEAP